MLTKWVRIKRKEGKKKEKKNFSTEERRYKMSKMTILSI